jgi:hypothetical protein
MASTTGASAEDVDTSRACRRARGPRALPRAQHLLVPGASGRAGDPRVRRLPGHRGARLPPIEATARRDDARPLPGAGLDSPRGRRRRDLRRRARS